MTQHTLIAAIAAGLRLALILLAVGSLIASRRRDADASAYDDYKRRAWRALGWAIIAYSPVHALYLMGRGLGGRVNVWFDAAGTALACYAFILLLAARGIRAGVSAERVRRGILTNVGVTLTMVGVAWIYS